MDDKVQQVIELLRQMADDNRQQVLNAFCRVCAEDLNGGLDWADRNYCPPHSPDPEW
jgi:hypothetical protein